MSEPTGIKWPFQFANGKVATSTGEQHIRESIMQILAIDHGEYLFRPQFGSNLPRRAFDPTNLSHLMVRDIREALVRMEPRIELLDVSVEVGPRG